MLCQRVEQGSYRTKTDKNGAPYYMHRLDGSHPAPPAPPLPAVNVNLADDETLHQVYGALLGGLSLSADHRLQLRQRGLTEEEIDRRGYRTLPKEGRSRLAKGLRERFGDNVLRVPGFFVKEGDRGRYLTLAGSVGLLIPVRDLAGRILALRIRRDQGEPKYVWLSSANRGGAGPGAKVHVPLGITTPAAIVRITEGELKSDVAMVWSDVPTFSLPGVGNWRPCVPLLKEIGASTVRLAFDQDSRRNEHVARALDNCAAGLIEAGFTVELETWPDEFKGIDDALNAGETVSIVPAAEARQAIADIVIQGTAGAVEPRVIDHHDGGEIYKPVQGEDQEWKPFPVGALPHIVAEFVHEISEAIQVDHVAVALPVLAAIAGSIGNARVIQLKRTWTEPAIIFGCLIADPSTRKTAALEWAMGPVKKWNSEKLRDHRLAMEQHEHDMEVWCAMNSKDSADGAVRSKPKAPVKRRAMVQDITVETLIRELQNNPRGLLVKRDELRGWFSSFGRYAKSGAGADESFWLEVRGTSFDYDRKTGDQASIHIEHLTVSVIGTTQPETWKGLASQAMFDSGMVARILLAYPPKRLGTFHSADPDDGVLRLYDHLLRSLLELDWDRCQQPDWSPLPMVFTPQALGLWTTWCDEGRRAQFRADGEVASLLGKLEAYCARFALCFACCDRVMGGSEDVVEERHVAAAIVLADWFHYEVMRIYSSTRMGDAEAEAARVLQKVEDMGGSITPRELWSSNRVKWGAGTSPRDRSQKARVALQMLVEDGRLIEDQHGRFFLPGRMKK